MKSDSKTRKDAGANTTEGPKVTVHLPNDTDAVLHSTARARKKLRRKRRRPTPPAEGA